MTRSATVHAGRSGMGAIVERARRSERTLHPDRVLGREPVPRVEAAHGGVGRLGLEEEAGGSGRPGPDRGGLQEERAGALVALPYVQLVEEGLPPTGLQATSPTSRRSTRPAHRHRPPAPRPGRARRRRGAGEAPSAPARRELVPVDGAELGHQREERVEVGGIGTADQRHPATVPTRSRRRRPGGAGHWFPITEAGHAPTRARVGEVRTKRAVPGALLAHFEHGAVGPGRRAGGGGRRRDGPPRVPSVRGFRGSTAAGSDRGRDRQLERTRAGARPRRGWPW